ncbi:class I SAM-dependent methyltransferase [Nocardia wallacei]|uniref:class I SAM-dependent methyltransferase n=1 Tax=Nocardia wallacei TaxID=480035 RepID=UPI0024571C84|nr:class I SAM-dependent methyltransferase [Nocardia wallacei]
MTERSSVSRDAGQASRSQRQAAQAFAFDQLVHSYGTAFANKPEQVRAGNWLIERLSSGARVLDVGCGTGIPTARQLAEAGLQVVGIDISSGMVSAASAAVPEASFRQCDVLDLTETDFDAVVAFFSLLMLPRSEIVRALAALRDAIRPGGYLVISMVEAELDDTPVKFLETDVRVSGYHRDELRRVVEDAGFDVVSMNAVSNTPAVADAAPETELYVYSRRW